MAFCDEILLCYPVDIFTYPVNTIPSVSVKYSWKIFGFLIWSYDLHVNFQIILFPYSEEMTATKFYYAYFFFYYVGLNFQITILQCKYYTYRE